MDECMGKQEKSRDKSEENASMSEDGTSALSQ